MHATCKIVKVPSVMSSTGESWFALVNDNNTGAKYTSNGYPMLRQLEKLLPQKMNELHQGNVDTLFFIPIGDIE